MYSGEEQIFTIYLTYDFFFCITFKSQKFCGLEVIHSYVQELL